MAESKSHKKAKAKAAGKSGKTEVPLSRNRRLDAATKKTATEVERSGSSSGLEKAAKRLKDSGKPRKVLQVPQKDMDKAVASMKKVGVSGTVARYRYAKSNRPWFPCKSKSRNSCTYSSLTRCSYRP